MQVNESKIAFICFHLLFGIGTFQWVTADSNKKSNSQAVPFCESDLSHCAGKAGLIGGF
jgi:hypothetical protein